MNELKEFIAEQMEAYKEENDEIQARVQECREDIEYQEDILEDLEELNLLEGIIEGLLIVSGKIKEMKNPK
jgi:hypothetical protein